jgi:hypothetical protein
LGFKIQRGAGEIGKKDRLDFDDRCRGRGEYLFFMHCMDFDAAAAAVPSFAFELTEEQLSHADSKDTMISLPVVKFRNVHTISLLVESNQTNDDESATLLSRIQLFGHAGDSFDVASIKDVSKQDQE